MNCPYCHREIASAKTCPYCRYSIHYGRNTEVYQHAAQDSLTLQELLSDVTKPHSHQELASSLLRQPSSGMNMLHTWQKPWLFARLFAFLFAFSALLFFLITKQPFARNMYIIFGCMVVPLSLMVFIWEMDIHGNISIFDLISLLFFGGVASLVLTAQLYTYFPDSTPPFAAFIEEPAKLIICILFIHFSKRRYYALDGLAIGAAVAAGFAFMETISYVYRYGIHLVTQRGVTAICSHILYTAPFVGALTMVMQGHPFHKDYLKDDHFLRILACGVVCHFINNMDFQLLVFIDHPYLFISLKTILKCIVVWAVLLHMIQCGIRQALQVAGAAPTPVPTPLPKPLPKPLPDVSPSAQRELACTRGQYIGRRIRLPGNRPVVFGRSESCSVRFSAGTVSSAHCQLRIVAGGVEVRDLQSRNGTYVNGSRLRPNQTVILRPGDTLGLDSNREQFTIR